MEFKGTKLTWNVQNELAVWGSEIGDMVCIVNETKDLETSLRNDVCRANAKLIASAPELLRALQYIKMACELNSKHAKKNKDKLAYYELSDIASKAINKALN